MTFRRAVTYKLSGPLDQSALDGLRTRLDLTSRGRLADDWDQIFGERRVDAGGGQLKVLLARDDVRPGWDVTLSVAGDPPPTALADLEAEVVAAAAEGGLTVQEIFRLA
jgi:hypothetical protein